jgi:hypothetical protein
MDNCKQKAYAWFTKNCADSFGEDLAPIEIADEDCFGVVSLNHLKYTTFTNTIGLGTRLEEVEAESNQLVNESKAKQYKKIAPDSIEFCLLLPCSPTRGKLALDKITEYNWRLLGYKPSCLDGTIPIIKHRRRGFINVEDVRRISPLYKLSSLINSMIELGYPTSNTSKDHFNSLKRLERILQGDCSLLEPLLKNRVEVKDDPGCDSFFTYPSLFLVRVSFLRKYANPSLLQKVFSYRKIRREVSQYNDLLEIINLIESGK